MALLHHTVSFVSLESQSFHTPPSTLSDIEYITAMESSSRTSKAFSSDSSESFLQLENFLNKVSVAEVLQLAAA
jgi:hypothetical protein